MMCLKVSHAWSSHIGASNQHISLSHGLFTLAIFKTVLKPDAISRPILQPSAVL